MPPKKQTKFKPSVSAESQFGRALRKIARVAGHIVEAHVNGTKLDDEIGMQTALKNYAKLIEPWARRQSAKMIEKVGKANARAYKSNSKEMARLIRENVSKSALGDVITVLMNEQVELIKSIPLRAGLRAQRLATQAIYSGSRADEIAEALKKSTEVSESGAMLIARTEVARANATLTEARAVAVGAQGYYWRTTMDGAERDSHAKMNGKFILYSKPPTLSDGTTGHAGTFPNCRCFQDVQFDE